MWRDAPLAGHPQRQPRSIALVDIGTYKTVVMLMVADRSAPAGWRIAGLGNQLSRGVKARVIMQIDEAVQALRAALTQAERMAGFAAEAALVTYGSGRLTARSYEMADSGTDFELAAIGQAAAQQSGLCPLHTDVVAGDATHGPGHGHAGGRVVRVQAADEGPVRSLMHVVERADLAIAGVMPAAYAAGLAVATVQERAAGVTVLDLGAGASTAAFFAAGRFTGSISVPVGGATMTFDVARELQVPVTEAERIKLSCGTLTRAQSFVHGALGRTVRPSQSDGDSDHEGAAIQAQLHSQRAHALVADRASSLIGLIADRVAASPAARGALRSVVLTGGVAQMDGLVERAEALFGVPVRVGRPTDPGGMFVENLMMPAFGTAIGAGHALAGGGSGWWFAAAPAFEGAERVRATRPWATTPVARPTVRDQVS